MDWISNNVGVLITFAVLIVSLISTWVKYGTAINQLKMDSSKRDDDHEKDLKRIETSIEGVGVSMQEISNKLQIHISDITIHIDPTRDALLRKEDRAELARRFDNVDLKIDNLITKLINK